MTIRNADLLPDTLPSDPMHWADAWIKEAAAANVQRNPNAMTLATVAASGQASARVVLCKSFVPDPGYLVFYTNYRSRKAVEIENDNRVSALFHWDSFGRQIRIEGLAVRSPEQESDAYFESRDWGSRLGAWGSDQSATIESRDALVRQIRSRAADLGIALGETTTTLRHDNRVRIERPPHWGGYRLWVTAIELWIEGTDRIHDRALWTRDIVRRSEESFSVTPWTGTRLQP
ncbi:MAG: pyridoxamine 5'-phosphate oxidase [Woeseiaceae bacterium]